MNSLEKNGYVLIKNVFTKKLINKMKNRLLELKPKAKVPFTDIPWGYGNLISDKIFSKILSNKIINKQLKNFFKSDQYTFNHLMVNNKASFFGPSVEWHQEIYNLKTYAPGHQIKNWRNFLQTYIAIDRQDIHNGCLKVLKGSHKYGVQKNFDVINENLSHKRSIIYKDLIKLEKKCKLVDCIMDPGDVLMFNHLLVHGSPSNYSPKLRRSIVLQARKVGIARNETIYNKETNFRTNFVIKALKKRTLELKKSNFYKAFK